MISGYGYLSWIESLRSTSVVCGVRQCLAGAWADSASVELSDVLISVTVLSLTVIFLSVYPRNEPVCWSGGNCAVTRVVGFWQGQYFWLWSDPCRFIRTGMLQPQPWCCRAPQMQYNEMIVGVVRYKCCLMKEFVTQRGLVCCTADCVSSACVSTEVTYTWFRWESGSDQEVAAVGNAVILSAPSRG